MKIERSKLNRWLNNPVTKAYFEAQKQLRAEIAEALLESNEVEPDRIVHLYHRARGAMEFLSAFKDPVDTILVLHEIEEDDQEGGAA